MLRPFWNRPERSFMVPRSLAVVNRVATVGSEMAVRHTAITATTSSSGMEKPRARLRLGPDAAPPRFGVSGLIVLMGCSWLPRHRPDRPTHLPQALGFDRQGFRETEPT
jgi:hypothetical protein